MTEDIVNLFIGILMFAIFAPLIFESLSLASSQINNDYVEESEHERIVGNLESDILNLESNNSELRSNNRYLNKVVSNYSENRSDLQQERNHYEELSKNLSEENEALESENNQLEDEVNRTVPIQRAVNYAVMLWDIQVKVVHVFAVSISVTFAITLTLVELNLIGWEGKVSIKELYIRIKDNLDRILKIINERWCKMIESLEDDSKDDSEEESN